ncbi:protein kinase domain-containing protein [Aerosakkonema funiforme]|uniref:protein kinase domain-containing protein n=1 Tax=Aerosakkonema funiforme TaxID=1246630 RepID=UPI0035BB4FBC
MNFISCSKGHQNSSTSSFCSTCGEELQQKVVPPTIIMGLTPGTRLRDRYVIKQVLGQGGFGRTYLVADEGRFNALVVIKEFLPNVQGTYALQKAEELFQQEAFILHRLQHSQIPRFWEIFREGTKLFLVEDFISGQTYQSLLNQRLQQGKRFNESEILHLFRELLPVLGYLHRQGVIHRDISPDNIIHRSADGLPVLIDLGAVKQAAFNAVSQVGGMQNQNMASPATRVGKPGYAPQEQMQFGIVAPHSDLYALAVTAVVLMTGKQPLQLIDQYTMNWIWNKELTLSPSFSSILNKMLAKDPYGRFQSADEVIQVIPQYQGDFHVNHPAEVGQANVGGSQQRKMPTTSGKRFLNLMIDFVFLWIFSLMFGLTLGIFLAIIGVDSGIFDSANEEVLGWIVFIIYNILNYLILESTCGKSMAKFITKTKVVMNDGRKPDFAVILVRTLCRFIPFDALSFLLSGNPIGWHDRLSKTMVVDDR